MLFRSGGQSKEEMMQDLHNNAVGAKLGNQAASFNEIMQRVPAAMDTRPYSTDPSKAHIRHPNESTTPYKVFRKGGSISLDQMRYELMRKQ